jgi:hypothetical protein
MDDDKIKAVKEWPVSRSMKALWGFLGLTGYYRKFIHNYGFIAAQLTALLKEAFQWSPTATEAFNALKHTLTTGPVLQLPNFDEPFMVDCDASATGFGACIKDKAPSPSSASLWHHSTLSWLHMSANLVSWCMSFATGGHTYGEGSSSSAPTIATSSISSTSACPPFPSCWSISELPTFPYQLKLLG